MRKLDLLVVILFCLAYIWCKVDAAENLPISFLLSCFVLMYRFDLRSCWEHANDEVDRVFEFFRCIIYDSRVRSSVKVESLRSRIAVESSASQSTYYKCCIHALLKDTCQIAKARILWESLEHLHLVAPLLSFSFATFTLTIVLLESQEQIMLYIVQTLRKKGPLEADKHTNTLESLLPPWLWQIKENKN
jgi:hypothetical protein